MKKMTVQLISAMCLLFASCQFCLASNMNSNIYTAMFDFSEKGRNLDGMGNKISTIVFSNLVMNPNISLVDREEMQKLEDEAVLTLSGMVNSQQAIQIGQLTGAKIIVTGTVFEIEDRLIIVAKIISTETSRVLGASVKGKSGDSIVTLSDKLSEKISKTISKNASSLISQNLTRNERLATLKKQLLGTKKPSITIDIKEHHISRASSDPAAETEMLFYSKELGFEVFDKQNNTSDFLITGEGFSELATRNGNLIGVKARLEVKVIERATKKIIAVDRQTELEIDLSEIVAGKKALQRAAAKIAERILPKIII